MTEAQDIERIWLSLPSEPTTAQIIRALESAWRAGHAEGLLSGQKHMAQVMELVTKALP